ncbi:MAG: hypothetical protein MJ142_05935 [Clostridia bacterium]|nr:hypothetical protein [Clostridia bacterium]
MYSAVLVLRQVYDQYRVNLDECAKKYKPGEGLFGIGHSIKDDPCHKVFDTEVSGAVDEIVARNPSSEETEEAVRFLFSQGKNNVYPVAAQLMLFAEERHILRMIPLLSDEAALRIYKEYAACYKRWERLPVQKEVYKALKARC